MSLLGSGALGNTALGHPPDSNVKILTAAAGSALVTGNAGLFRISALSSTATFTVIGIAGSFSSKLLGAAASYAVTCNNGVLSVGLLAKSAAYIVTGNAAHLTRDYVNWFPLAGPSSGWGAIGRPSSAWTPVAAPTSAWTVNPAMAIPQKVST